MKEKKFELFVGCFPGGDVYCNKAVVQYGDYKKIAFIDYTGKLELSVAPSYIPGDVLLRIERDAEIKSIKYKEEWNKKTDLQKYSELLDKSGIGEIVYSHKLPQDFTLSDKIDFFEWIVYGWTPHSVEVAKAIEAYKKSKYYHGGIT